MASELRKIVRSAQLRLAGASLARALGSAGAVLAAMTLVGAFLQRLSNVHLLPWFAAVGGTVGVGLFIVRVRIPGQLAAASELDRQFRLNESISTAWQIRQGGDDAFRAAARSQGESLARRVSPADLNPGGWGQWRWLAALAMLGLVPAVHRPLSIQSVEVASGAIVGDTQQDGREEAKSAAARERRQVPTGESGTVAIGRQVAADEREGDGRPAPRASRGESAGVSAGGGLAQGYSRPDAPQPQAFVRDPRRGTPPGPPDMAGAGGGRSLDVRGTISVAGTVEPSAPDATTRPGAGAESSRGDFPDMAAVPADYREIVKAYYRR